MHTAKEYWDELATVLLIMVPLVYSSTTTVTSTLLILAQNRNNYRVILPQSCMKQGFRMHPAAMSHCSNTIIHFEVENWLYLIIGRKLFENLHNLTRIGTSVYRS